MNSELRDRILGTIKSNKVVLFMKGNKTAPQCGFSAQVASILTRKGVDFLAVDVLSDAELRQGLKEFSSWPTFPQLYVDGSLVGGADIVSGLELNGQLDRALGIA